MGFLEDGGYDATGPSYLPLVAHPEWQGEVEGDESNEYRSVTYVDVQDLSEHYDVLSNDDRWGDDGLSVDNPDIVKEYVVTVGRTRNDSSNVTVARLRDDVDADAYARDEDDEFVDASTEGYRGSFSDAVARVYGDGLLARGVTMGPATDASEERRQEVTERTSVVHVTASPTDARSESERVWASRRSSDMSWSSTVRPKRTTF